MFSQLLLEYQLLQNVEMVAVDDGSICLLSTAEAIAVALVLDRADLLPLTMLDAFATIDEDLLVAALHVAGAISATGGRDWSFT